MCYINYLFYRSFVSWAVLPLLCLLLLSMKSAFAQQFNAQEGRLITASGKTLVGLIKDRQDIQEKVLFKPTGNADYRAYTTDEVERFYYAESYYKAVNMPDDEGEEQRRFLLCLVEGNMSLYKGKDGLYVEKSEGKLYRLEEATVVKGRYIQTKRHYVGLLTYLVSDCASVQQKVPNTDLREVDMAALIDSYNQCTNPSEKSKTTIDPVRIKVRWGAKAGVSVVSITDLFNGYKKLRLRYATNWSTSYVGGGMLALSYKDKISVRPELLITGKKSLLTRERNQMKEVISISLTTLQLPISLVYTFPTKKLRPFVLGGGLLGFTVGDQSYQQGLYQSDFHTDNDHLGYRFGGGLSYLLDRSSRVNLEYVYDCILTNGRVTPAQVRFISHNVTLGFFF